ncbi:MAG: hypothetical protein K8R35_02680 [Bacteroidales bacterium]|nr:hypothetical protein [Bacteroidales bacterium]
MNDIVIKGKWIKRELFVLLLSFGLAFIINIVGILKHGTEWKELLTQLHIVLFLSFVIYVLLWFIRLLIMLVLRPFKKN